MIPYILHVSILIGGCYLMYSLLLTKETFYQLNRWLLVGCILVSFLLPVIEIPASWSLQQQTASTATEWFLSEPSSPLPATEGESEVVGSTYVDSEPPQEETGYAPSPGDVSTRLSAGQFLFYVYLTGLVIFGLNWLVQLIALLLTIRKNPRFRDGRYWIVEMDKNVAPFSFFQYIFFNPGKYDRETSRQILEHEKVHIAQGHSFDLMLAELLLVFQWFNPFAWFYRNAIRDNLEFLTDHTMLDRGVNRESYQLNLLKVAVPNHPISFVTNYNQSILKKRIVMMNEKKSSLNATWKYLTILPILGLSIICLNAVNVASESLYGVNEAAGSRTDQDQTLTYGSETFSSPTENIATMPSLQGNMGVWKGTVKAENVCISFDRSQPKQGTMWIHTACFVPKEIADELPRGQQGVFNLVRDAGEAALEGIFKQAEGVGHFSFTPSESFKDYLKKEGIGAVKDETLFWLFLVDFGKNYITYLKQAGYTSVSDSQLRNLAKNDLSQAYLEKMLPALQSVGNQRTSVEQLIELKRYNVEPQLIAGFVEAGYTDLSPDQLIATRQHQVDAELYHLMKNAGFESPEMDQLFELKKLGVSTAFVAGLAQLGYENLSVQQIMLVKMHGVKIDFVKELKSALQYLPTIDQLVELNMQGVSLDFIRSLKKLGFTNMPVDQLIALQRQQVTPEFIENAIANGHQDMNLTTYLKLKTSQMAIPQEGGRSAGTTHDGQVIEQERQVPNFSKLTARSNLRIVLADGDEEKVIVKGNEEMVPLVKTEVKQGNLIISAASNYKSAYLYDVMVVVKDKYKVEVRLEDGEVISERKLEDLKRASGKN